MNTGFLGPAVATVLTVYGIETLQMRNRCLRIDVLLQQYLPFTVLKLIHGEKSTYKSKVATVLTVYGIETGCTTSQCTPNTSVATVLTVYGIETFPLMICVSFNKSQWLQQYLPFTVLKHLFSSLLFFFCFIFRLQQYLPFTVLKQLKQFANKSLVNMVATVLTVYGIETYYKLLQQTRIDLLQQYLPFTVLKLINFIHYKEK